MGDFHGIYDEITRSNDPELIASRLFIGSLPEGLRREEILAKFGRHGRVLGVTVNKKGFGFVQMSRPDEALRAQQAEHNSSLGSSQRIDVRPATTDGPRKLPGPNRPPPGRPPPEPSFHEPPMHHQPPQRRFPGASPIAPRSEFRGGPGGGDFAHNQFRSPDFQPGAPRLMDSGPGRGPMMSQGGMGVGAMIGGGGRSEDAEMLGMGGSSFQQPSQSQQTRPPISRFDPPGMAPGMGPGLGPGMAPGMGPGLGPGMAMGQASSGMMGQAGSGMMEGISPAVRQRESLETPASSTGVRGGGGDEAMRGGVREEGVVRRGAREEAGVQRPYDAAVVGLSSEVRGYAEAVERRLVELNLTVDVMFVVGGGGEDRVGRVVEALAQRGLLYVLLISPQHSVHKSLTLNILHSSPQGFFSLQTKASYSNLNVLSPSHSPQNQLDGVRQIQWDASCKNVPKLSNDKTGPMLSEAH